MPAAKLKTPRFLEMIQLVLSFVSVCAVVEASRIHAPAHDRPGYYAALPLTGNTAADRRLSDLARTERKRREAAQQSSRIRSEVSRLGAGPTSRLA